MLILSFFSWWYGTGWRDLANGWRSRLKRLYLDFSVPILLTTLFAPWRRIITTGEGSLGRRLRARLDNTVSRFVGLAVRLVVLVAAIILLLGGVLAMAVCLIIWPLLPPSSVILVIWGIVK